MLYPDKEESCFSVLDKSNYFGWNNFLCTFDSEGNVDYKFGLSNQNGIFSLWKRSQLIWRPTSSTKGSLRSARLGIQADGRLAIYWGPRLIFVWRSDCFDYSAAKLVLTSDGNVQELNDAGAIVWTIVWTLFFSQIRSFDYVDP
jgi:hypothetical protein